MLGFYGDHSKTFLAVFFFFSSSVYYLIYCSSLNSKYNLLGPHDLNNLKIKIQGS